MCIVLALCNIGSIWSNIRCTFPPSEVFCLRKRWILGYPSSAHQSLIRLCACAGWSVSLIGWSQFLMGAQANMQFMLGTGSYLYCLPGAFLSFVGIKSRQAGCPSPRFCDTSFRPGDCVLLEQTYFEVDGQMCPGCQICIHTGIIII